MASNDFTLGDIKDAVGRVTDGYLTKAQQDAAVQAIWTAKKSGGATYPDAFKAAISGVITTPATVNKLVAALPAALQAARDTRLAAKSGGTPPPDPAVEKRSKLDSLLRETETARNAAKTLADKANENAIAAESDAETAEKAATKLEELRPGSPEAAAGRTAATDTRTAAADTRTAHGEVDTQFRGADGNLVAVEGIVASNGSIPDAQDQVDQAQAAQRAAKRPAESATDYRTAANRGRSRVENLLKDAEAKKAEADAEEKKTQGEKEKSFFNREVRPRVIAIIAIGVALVALIFAMIGGLPPKVPMVCLIVIIAVAVIAVLMPPESGRRAAVGVAVIMIAIAGASFVMGGDTDTSGNAGESTTETDADGNTVIYETVDGTKYRIVQTPTPAP